MKTNNSINSAVSSFGWTSFTTVITGTSINPTIGAGTTQQSYYFQQGKSLRIQFTLNNNPSTATNGSGTYLFSIPSGFTIDTSIISTSLQTVLGSAFVNSIGVGACQVFDSTRYFMRVWVASPTNDMSLVGSTFFTLTTQTIYSAYLLVPVL